ncbi:DNA-binding response regulator [Puia dinghuensis]|uniref:DNA-binding response regulator n=1 Tax=Puia dinghuensis TaxID=1792502 RepID=A0A8J2UH51_9BACT|nr:DNA-binding response regulator [Puia dinghuensis]
MIADDHKVVLDGLVALLQEESSFSIEATAHNGRQVLELVRRHPFDICLLDINMPELDGIETTRLLKEERPEVKIIILTTYDEKEIINRLLQIGVAGYVLKNSTRQELVNAIKKVAEGGFYFSDEVQTSILNDYAQAEKPSKGEPEVMLTRREIEVLDLLSQEYTNDDIANALNISFRTVETHRKNMMQKTGASNLAGLLRYAYSKGLLK